MIIKIESQKGIEIVRLSGRLDRQADLDNQLKKLIDDEHQRLVVDLSQVDFIDSSGVGALVATWKRCLKSEGKLVLLTPSPRAKEVLTLAGLEELLEIYESEDEALRAVA